MREGRNESYGEPTTHRGARDRILHKTAALPSLVTLGNGLAGFAAIHFATKPLPPAEIAKGQEACAAWVAGNLVIAAWLVFAGMICDALDGQLARMTRRTSEFGKQLDSLCDAITFGVAPAILMLHAVQGVLFPLFGEVTPLLHTAIAGRAVWFIAAVYACCAIMRLARFTVETKTDISSHMAFSGLPSPAAALSVVSLVLLHAHLLEPQGWQAAPWLAETVVWAMPVITLITALLMVSRLRFTHVLNQYVQGRKPFGYIVRVAILVLAAIILGFQITLAASALLYVLSGPVHWLFNKAGRRKGPAGKNKHISAAAPPPATQDQSD
ncbi:MAG: phosphatidylcholine/phosphatidylserine synthase [Planctomycetes bacterium]|nr:phosphatidylcholine/phosphatidylserine synthase [Planctomycetota bacterium]